MTNYLYYPKLLFKQIFYPRKETAICITDVGWKLTLPKKFQLLSHKQLVKLGKRGERMFEMIIQKKVQYPGRRIMFMAHYEIQNKFTCSIAKLDELSVDEWKNQNDDLYNTLLKIYHHTYKNYAHVNITNESGARQKGDIIFNTLDVIASTPTRELYRTRLYSTIHKGFGLHITMAFAEAHIGEEMLNILRNSTFE